ncbi:hypothetical protein LINPERPRIM_LOCUS19261 [Linum perenne]
MATEKFSFSFNHR